jgi:hypothetical protein
MIAATMPASTPMVAVRLPLWPAKKASWLRTSTSSWGSALSRASIAGSRLGSLMRARIEDTPGRPKAPCAVSRSVHSSLS